MTRGSHALWATGLIISSVSVAGGCKHHRCQAPAPCDPFAAQYAPAGATPILPGPDAATPQPMLGDPGMNSEYQLYPQDMQGYGAQNYPAQTYPAQTYPAQTYPAPQTYNVPQTSPQGYPPAGTNGYGAPSTVPGGPTPTPALRPHTSPGYQYQQQYQQPRTYPAQPYNNGNYQPQSYRPSQYRRYQPQPGSYHAPAVTHTAPATSGTVTPSAPIQAAPIQAAPIQTAPAIQAPGNASPGDFDAGEADYRSTSAPAAGYPAQAESWRAARPARGAEMMAAADDHPPHISRHYKVPATARHSAAADQAAAPAHAGSGTYSRPLPQDPIPLPSR